MGVGKENGGPTWTARPRHFLRRRAFAAQSLDMIVLDIVSRTPRGSSFCSGWRRSSAPHASSSPPATTRSTRKWPRHWPRSKGWEGSGRYSSPRAWPSCVQHCAGGSARKADPRQPPGLGRAAFSVVDSGLTHASVHISRLKTLALVSGSAVLLSLQTISAG